ncbi:hypothetical protein BJF78_25995 [Pseudonocardia sp. CNS-139]|nr:hypothetical protein BJF78_25995 [Pseudonocardia sp. CNS-139]
MAGRYRMRELVGRGGMGSVWRATDELLGREVAIKQIRTDLQPAAEAAVARERTMREARIAAALHHPNVVSIFDVVIDGGQPWLVLEYVPSRSLGSILSEYGALHPAHVGTIGMQIAAALAAAHAAGIVHRDVKPDNILIASTPGQGDAVGWPGTVKLTDFGVSHATATPTLTSTGVLTGTPAYFAPETARGEGTDARSDVYSLGATLYAAVEGRPPFDAGDDNVLALLARIAQGGAPAPRRAGPLTAVLQQLTADDPAVRPTAEQARYALQQILAWPQQHAPAFPAPVQPGAPTLYDSNPSVRPGTGPGGQYARPAAQLPGQPTHISGPAVGQMPSQPGPYPPAYPAPPPLPPQQQRNPRTGIALAGLAVLLVAAVIAAVAVIAVNINPSRPADPQAGGDPTATGAPAPPTSTTPPVPSVRTIGDPRTADPCSLIDIAVLNRFGQAEIDRENSEFSACRADMTAASGAGVTYLVDFLSPPEVGAAAPGAQFEQTGDLTIVRQPGGPEQCERRLLFPDGNVVGIQAQLVDTISTDLCAIVDAGTDFAVQTIATTGVGTRTPLATTNPVAGTEACSLLTPSELAVVPGGDSARPESEYGGWGCIWEPAVASDHLVRMDYYRRYPFHDGDGSGTAFGGRPGAFLYQPGRYCLAQIDQRDYTGDDGEAHIDAVRIFVFGPGDEQEQCHYATTLAAAVAPKLPG